MARTILIAFACLAALAGAAMAQQAQPMEKQYTVAFDKTPWDDVFKWFSKESGLTYIDTVKPRGTLTLKSDRKYTLPQVLDLLNEALVDQKLVILLRSQTFLVHPSNERLPSEGLVSMLTLDELSSRGDTEVVQVIIPLNGVDAEDIAPQLKKLLSPFGTASAFGSDQIIVLDKVKNVRNIVHYIKTPCGGCDQFNITCKYASATGVANQVRRLVNRDVETESTPNTQNAWGSGGWGSGWGGNTSTQVTRRFRSLNISVDHLTNTIRMTGPVEKMLYAKELIQHIDVGTTPREIGGEQTWKAYPVPEGTAEAYIRLMNATDDFRDSEVRIQLAGPSRLHVFGLPADHDDVRNVLQMPPAFWAKPAAPRWCEPTYFCAPPSTVRGRCR